MIHSTEEVKAFAEANLGKTFRIIAGVFEGEGATVVGYTEREGLHKPSIIMEIHHDPFYDGWRTHEMPARAHILAVLTRQVSLWFVDIDNMEIIEEC